MIIVKVWCSQGSFKRLSAASQIGLEFDFLVFEEGYTGSTRKKNSQSKGENQRQTQPTNDVIACLRAWVVMRTRNSFRTHWIYFVGKILKFVTFARGSLKHEYFNFTLLPFIGTLYKSSVTEGFVPGMRQLPALFLLCNDMAQWVFKTDSWGETKSVPTLEHLNHLIN